MNESKVMVTRRQPCPEILIKMMSDLKMRKITTDEIDFKNSLNTLRTQIDVIDQGLLDTLGKRMKVAIEIGNLKKKNSPFLVYLYHDFEENNAFYKYLWKLSEILRWIISRQNFFFKSLICDLIAIFIYYPLNNNK